MYAHIKMRAFAPPNRIVCAGYVCLCAVWPYSVYVRLCGWVRDGDGPFCARASKSLCGPSRKCEGYMVMVSTAATAAMPLRWMLAMMIALMPNAIVVFGFAFSSFNSVRSMYLLLLNVYPWLRLLRFFSLCGDWRWMWMINAHTYRIFRMFFFPSTYIMIYEW